MNKSEIKDLYKIMFTEYPDIVDMNQLQKMLGIGRKLSYKLVGDGYIPALKVGNSFRIAKINVIDYALQTMKA